MLQAVRWLWIATVAVSLLSFISSLVTDPQSWYGIAGGVISISLLLLPVTRRYFANEAASPPALAG
jgi:membrane protein insertase Oxa1/YidC/SpoIIIJ